MADEDGHGLKIGVADHYCESNEAAYRVGPFLIGEILPRSSGLFDRNFGSPKCSDAWPRSCWAVTAILGVFIEIPIISNYAFWVLVGAHLVDLASARPAGSFNWMVMVSIVLTLLAIVGVFVEIPIVSNYAFWVMAAAFLLWFSAQARPIGSL